VTQVTVIRGKVTSQLIFKTRSGVIVASAYQDKMRWLYHESGVYKRDIEGTEIFSGPLDPFVRYRLRQGQTHFGQGTQLVTLTPGRPVERRGVDTYGNLPMFDSNGQKLFWLQGGNIMREGDLGFDFPESVGQILQGQTLFWTGPTFGFGFYRASTLTVAFVFNTTGRGINDTVKLPRISGQLIDSTCVFAKDRCWFFLATQEAGKTLHHCHVISQAGVVLASTQAEAGDGSWLGTIRGKAAAGRFLFAPTDDGMYQAEVANGQIVQTRTYPDTEPFVDANSQLFAATEGIYVVDREEIHLLRMQ
jgi:hypothetical protein